MDFSNDLYDARRKLFLVGSRRPGTRAVLIKVNVPILKAVIIVARCSPANGVQKFYRFRMQVAAQ